MTNIATHLMYLLFNSSVFLMFSIIDILKVIHDLNFESQESVELIITDLHLIIISYGLLLFWMYSLKQSRIFTNMILIQDLYFIRYIILVQLIEIPIIILLKLYTSNYISQLMLGGTIVSNIIKIGFIVDYHHWKTFRLQSIVELIPPTKHICQHVNCTICPCAICYEDHVDHIIALKSKDALSDSPCKHEIHYSCWMKWIKLKPHSPTIRCPLCMTQI